MHALERRMLRTLRDLALVPQGSRGLVCVSGGPDSTALLHLLHAVRGSLALALDVLHFDHGLRPESAADADWVARQAAALELSCHVVRAEHLAGLQRGVQAAARTWRNTEARRLAAQWDAQWIATGHQRDDHLETLLLKWLRGAHITRLRGMAWRGGPFVRPLLGCSRAELEAYLRSRGVEWLEDPSNRSPRYKRNRVRHELLPLLDDLAEGGAGARLGALEAQSAQVSALVQAMLAAQPVPAAPAEAAVPWIDADALAALPHLAAATALHDFVVERRPGTFTATQVEAVLSLLATGGPAWAVDLSHGRRLTRRGGRLLLEAQAVQPAAPVRHAMGERVVIAPADWHVHALPPEAPPDAGVTLHNLPPRAELLLRLRAAGDRFQPPWRSRPLRLAAFLRDQHVPLWERERLPVVVLEGQVIAVYPRFVAHGYAAPAGNAAPLRLEAVPP